jgi:hypothetical protein
MILRSMIRPPSIFRDDTATFQAIFQFVMSCYEYYL